jgi:hypothetical protein
VQETLTPNESNNKMKIMKGIIATREREEETQIKTKTKAKEEEEKRTKKN